MDMPPRRTDWLTIGAMTGLLVVGLFLYWRWFW